MTGRFVIILLALVCFLGGFACSKRPDDASKKGAIEQVTEKVADDALHSIQDPINQAKAVQNISADRQKMIDESADEK
ncbi:MAG: hypothetical protein KJ737_05795 [Proteobacteria bacterium]|nr:hypothetical protein [Pseudomonadota bacterium]